MLRKKNKEKDVRRESEMPRIFSQTSGSGKRGEGEKEDKVTYVRKQFRPLNFPHLFEVR